MAMIGWLVAIVLFVIIEINTMALTTIWFAGGSLAAFLAAGFGASVKVQLVMFLIVSCILLIFTRPFATKFINKGTVKTNVAGLIGKKARVTAEINNELSQGAAVVNGQEWTARAEDEKQVIPVGESVLIKDIRGVKLIVERIKEEKL
ncbi:MAG: NfeD family protein [Lachnospiraceae bacterium]|nr:NfeD family protein [Lachnospiraceae bacterium]